MPRPVQTLLLVEALLSDRELYRRYLLFDPTYTYQVLEADSVITALELCRTQKIDAILVNYLLPDANGLQFLESLQAQNNGTSPPVVMVSGESDAAIAVQAIKLGAEDYLVKNRLTPELLQFTLKSAIENARLRLQLKQAEVALHEANQQIAKIWESMTDAYTMLDRQWRIVYTNQASNQVFRQLTDLEPEEFLGKTHWEVLPQTVGTIVEREYRRAMAQQVAVHFEMLYEPSRSWFEVHAYPSPAGLGIYFRDISDRKLAQETVEQQLTEIENIYKTAPVGLCFVDIDLRFMRINEQLAEINGLPVSEHIGRSLREILPEMADQLEPLYQQVIASGKPILNLEVQGILRAQPGVERHWSISYYPHKDSHQRVVGVNVMVQEITNRKRSEEARERAEVALRQSERRFSAVFDQTFELMALISLDGVVLDVNQAALNSVSAQRQDLVGKRFWQTPWCTYSLDITNQLKEAIAQAAKGQVIRYEIPFYNSEGKICDADFSLKPVFDENDRATMLIAEGREITERIRDEQRLQESEERLQLGIQVAGVALARFDYAANAVTLSPEAAALYGISQDELIVSRDRLHATFHPDDRAMMAQIIEQVIDPKGSGWFARDHRVVWQNGEVRWLSVRKKVFFNRSNNCPRPEYAILAAVDITDRKHYEATIQEQLAQIEAIYASARLGYAF